MNMDEHDHIYRIGLAASDDDLHLIAPETVVVKAGEIADVPVRLQSAAEEARAQHSRAVTFTLQANDEDRLLVHRASRFIMPVGGAA